MSTSSLTFSVVGAGKVGSSLAHWLSSSGGHLHQVASRHLESAKSLANSLGGRPVPLSSLCTRGDDLLLIAVSDSSLAEVSAALGSLDQAPVVLHTSGQYPAETLAELRSESSAIGSLHPLKAFPKILPSPSEAEGIVFGIDGDPNALAMADRIAKELGGVPVTIPPAVRSQYHLAATMAAGGVVTLLAAAAELAESVGLDQKIVGGYLDLAQGALRMARSTESISSAITGPVARGEIGILQRQIEEVRDLDPDLASFLESLAQRTLYYCRKSGSETP